MNYPKTILITGANGQTAINIAKELLLHGSVLILLVHNRTERTDLLKKAYPNQCHVVKCDLCNYNQTSETLSAFLQAKGLMPEALIHTAAIRSFDAQALFTGEPEIWNQVISSNISMAYNILRCVLPLMVKQNAGKVVVMGSNVTRTGLPYGSAYAAAKSALANLVRTVAWEMAGYNIQINMISPAPLETALEEDYQGDYLKFRQEYFEAYKKSHPAHKLVTMDDVTHTILTLINKEISSISGEEIYLTGGVL